MKEYVDFRAIEAGDGLPSVTKAPVTKVQLVQYSWASGDFNPIHTDDSTAQAAGLKGVIAQGILIMGFVGQAITTWAPKQWLRKFKVRLMDMTFPGDVITVEATVTEKTAGPEGLRVVCDTAAKDENGRTKLSGKFEVLVPE